MTVFPELLLNVPVADLRREPSFAPMVYGKNALQETQLLLGEKLRLIEENVDWIYVEALEQARHSSLKGWHGYYGWLPRSSVIPVAGSVARDLVVTAPWVPVFEADSITSRILLQVSIGTCLPSICRKGAWWQVSLPDGKLAYIAAAAAAPRTCSLEQPAVMGNKIVAEAQKFLGCPYHWGGRSAYRPAGVPLTGVDCSGLSNLLYRLQGIDIPRDAHDQFLKCQRKSGGAQLKPGDLVFSREGESASGRVDHVMIYTGGDEVVEATLAHGQVHSTTIYGKCGRRLTDIGDGERAGKHVFFFGSFLYP